MANFQLEQLFEQYFQSETGQAAVARAVSYGNMSRLFNDMLFPETTARNILQTLQTAEKTGNLQQCYLDIIKDIAQPLCNADMSDISIALKKSIGDSGYQTLLTLCDDDSQILVDNFLKSISALVSMSITEQFNNEIGVALVPIENNGLVTTMSVDKETQGPLTSTQMDALVPFQSGIYYTSHNATIHLTREYLTTPTPAEEALASDVHEKECREWNDIILYGLRDLQLIQQSLPLSKDDQARMTRIIAVFDRYSNELSALCEKFDMKEAFKITERDCDNLLDTSMQELTNAMQNLPKMAQSYCQKKTWFDKFWDMVSKITKWDLRTTDSKNRAVSKRVDELPEITRERQASFSSRSGRSSSRSESSTEQKEEEEELRDGHFPTR